ncbi:MAG: hypothetical protein HY321_09295 [Armatimonadetes bacterium]|nr:hypothetical protein [Armatimonadota bacterium]
MVHWMMLLASAPEPAGPEAVLRRFAPEDQPLSKELAPAEGGWVVSSQGRHVYRLFEVADPGVEQAMLAYRADLKAEGLKGSLWRKGRAYLEMWCRFPGRGEFFSKGFHDAVSGTTDWVSCQTPFYLKAGERPDLIKLNLVVEGAGTVWIRNVELVRAPLKG